MSEIILTRLRNHILNDVSPALNSFDANGGDDKKLSRGLVAIVLAALSGKNYEQVARFVTDGTKDNGVDGVMYDESRNRLYILQSKWSQSGSKTIDVGSLEKFIRGVGLLLNERYDEFNERFGVIKSTLSEWIRRDPEVVLTVVYNSQSDLSVDCLKILDEFKRRNNTDHHELVTHQVFKLDDLMRAQRVVKSGGVSHAEVNLLDWGKQEQPYYAIYGRVSCADVAEWYRRERNNIFSENIRAVLFDSEINESIEGALLAKPEEFWYLNNGITVIANKLKRKAIGLGGACESSFWEVENLRVVNGAQTTGAIYSAYCKNPQVVGRAYVNVKIISLEDAPYDFGSLITKTTNTQNRVEAKDFLALEDLQYHLAEGFLKIGVHYSFKRGDERFDPAQSLEVQEAAIAIACAGDEMSLVVAAKRNSGSLVDKDGLYQKIFGYELSVRDVWEWVKILREIDAKLYTMSSDKYGRRAQIAFHGNRFIAHVVFLAKRRGFKSDAADMVERIHSALLITLEATPPESYLAVLFKNTDRCIELRNSVFHVLGVSDGGEADIQEAIGGQLMLF
jgi:hypothetical protein